MGEYSEAFVAFDVAKRKHAVAIAGHCHVNIGRTVWNQSYDVTPIMRRAGRSSPAAKY
jgi:hypothetical protein